MTNKNEKRTTQAPRADARQTAVEANGQQAVQALPKAPSQTQLGQPLSPQDGMLLFPALALGALVGFGFSSIRWIPGLGVTLLGLLFTASGLYAARKRLRWSWGNGLLLIGALLLLCCYGLWANEPMRLLGAPVAAGSLLVALFHLAGRQAGPLHQAGLIRRSFALSLGGLFRYAGLPLRSLKGRSQGSHARLKAIGLGLLMALPLAGLAGLLLAKADQVFSTWFSGLSLSLNGTQLAQAGWNLAKSLLLGLMAFSLLYRLRHGQPADIEPTARAGIAPLSLGIAIAALNLLYLMFAYIQFTYLFGGSQHAAMQGGWAQYARSGFFELVAVALINLGLVMLCSLWHPRHGPLRLLCGLLLALSALILASAARRMALYIAAFGPSLLRLITLWGMAMIAAAILAGCARLIWPGFRPFPILLALTLSSWLALNLMGPAGRVADWQAQAYLEGRLGHLDYAYLVRLGPDALPALTRLQQAGHSEASAAMGRLRQREAAPWYAASLSEYRLRHP